MQAGHVPLALAIATYDWSPEMAVFCLGMHFLPNADSLVVKAGFAKPEFHCTVTHSILFALVVSGIVALFSPRSRHSLTTLPSNSTCSELPMSARTSSGTRSE